VNPDYLKAPGVDLSHCELPGSTPELRTGFGLSTASSLSSLSRHNLHSKLKQKTRNKSYSFDMDISIKIKTKIMRKRNIENLDICDT
jgi:hypothetical protein